MRPLISSSAIPICIERSDEAKDILAALNIRDNGLNEPSQTNNNYIAECLATPLLTLAQELTQKGLDLENIRNYIADARIAIERLQTHYSCRKAVDFIVADKIDNFYREFQK